MKDPKTILDSNNFDIGKLDTNMGDLDTDMGDLNTDISQTEKERLDVEKESKQEIGEKLQKIRENEKKFRKQLDIETDTDFYFQVLFKSPDELHKFLKKHNIELHHDDYVFFEDIEHLFKDGEE